MSSIEMSRPEDRHSDGRENKSDAARLEELWSGEFGASYSKRNSEAASGRAAFWHGLLDRHPVHNVLEVGCNVGGNLVWIKDKIASKGVFGVDINQSALLELRKRLPEINALWSPARWLPFRDGAFELVFTAGVLIHQPDTTLPLVIAEMFRCSSKFVLAIEYFSEIKTMVEYRGYSGALFKRDYGTLIQELFPSATLVESGDLAKNEGWDDVRFWLFVKEN